jgi:hypothetical protein
MDRPAGAAGADQAASAQHSQMPAQPGLTYPQRIGQLLNGHLVDAGEKIQDPQPCQAGQRLVMGAELAKGRRRCKWVRHIKESL